MASPQHDMMGAFLVVVFFATAAILAFGAFVVHVLGEDNLLGRTIKDSNVTERFFSALITVAIVDLFAMQLTASGFCAPKQTPNQSIVRDSAGRVLVVPTQHGR